jgi:hypothetical protein
MAMGMGTIAGPMITTKADAAARLDEASSVPLPRCGEGPGRGVNADLSASEFDYLRSSVAEGGCAAFKEVGVDPPHPGPPPQGAAEGWVRGVRSETLHKWENSNGNSGL